MAGPVSPEAIDALLPQTQCTRCGYTGCKPYAEAIAAGYGFGIRTAPGVPAARALRLRQQGVDAIGQARGQGFR